MALGDPYVTAAELKTYLNITGATDDALVLQAVNSASRQIERYCGRQFNKTTSATARVYRTDRCDQVQVDDFHTTTGLVIKNDTADDGTYAETWSSSDYVLEPFNGVEDGVTGFPYRKIVAVESTRFYTGPRARVEVTAQWGWTAVPDVVKQATYILAAQIFGLKNATLGVAGFGEFGVVRVRDIPQVAALVDPLRHPAATAVVA
jgi:hypothetical protein